MGAGCLFMGAVLPEIGRILVKKGSKQVQNRKKRSKKYAQNPMFSIGLAYV